MALYTDAGNPQKLSGFARKAVESAPNLTTNSLGRWLPNIKTDDLIVQLDQFVTSESDLAEARAIGAEPSIVDTETSGSQITVPLWAVGTENRVGEYAQLRGEGTLEERTKRQVLEAIKNASLAIANRYEVARSDALFNGKIEVNENRVKFTLDFNRPAENSVVKTGAGLWSEATTATPLDDIEAWISAYVAINGEKPGSVLMSQKIVDTFAKNIQVREALFGIEGAKTAHFVTEDSVRSYLRSKGVAEFYTHDHSVGRGANRRRVTPEDKLIFLPAAGSYNAGAATDLGATLWSRTAQSQMGEYNLQGQDQIGIVAAAYRIEASPDVLIQAHAIASPALINPQLSFVAKVL